MLILLLALSSGFLSSFSSRLSSHRSKISFILQIWIFFRFLPSTSSTVTSSPSLMSLVIVSISGSIRLKAAQFPPIWVGNTTSDYPGQNEYGGSWDSTWLSASSWSLQAQRHSRLPFLAQGKCIVFALLMLDLKQYWTWITRSHSVHNTVIFCINDVLRYNTYIKLIWTLCWPLQESPWHCSWNYGCVSFESESFSNKLSPEKHHDKYCIYNQIYIQNYPMLCYVGWPWPCITKVIAVLCGQS